MSRGTVWAEGNACVQRPSPRWLLLEQRDLNANPCRSEEGHAMASSACHPCGFELPCDLKITFLNNSVPRSKRQLGEIDERDEPEGKRCCYAHGYSSSPPRWPSLANGVTSSPVGSLPTCGSWGDSDVDDSLLEFSDGERPDSPTGLSREDEDKLLSDNSAEDLKTPCNAVRLGLSLQKVEGTWGYEALEFGQAPKALEGAESAAPARTRSPSACLGATGPLGGGSALSKEDSRGGGGSGPDGPLPRTDAVRFAETRLGLQTEQDLSGGRERGAAQAVPERGGLAEGPSEGLASINEPKPGGSSASDALPSAEGKPRSPSSEWEATPAPSCSARDQRNNHTENPPAAEPKRPRRICIQEKDLEASKRKYISAVLDHAHGRPVISEVNELHALIKWVASEYQEYGRQHTTDLTVRNYAQRSNRSPQRFSLSEWVEKNGRKVGRFAAVPDRFRRSPVPS